MDPEKLPELAEELKWTVVDYALRANLDGKGEFLAAQFEQCRFEITYDARYLRHEGEYVRDIDSYQFESELYVTGMVVHCTPEIFDWSNEHNGWNANILNKLIRGCITEFEIPTIGYKLRRIGHPQISNQGAAAGPCPYYDDLGMGFRSKAEVAVSKALRAEKVLFFPLPAAVRGNFKIEPDFLICDEGRWGVLEVQGKPYHTDSTREYERFRNYSRFGIKYAAPYDADRCHADPGGVVRDFLAWLRRGYLTPG